MSRRELRVVAGGEHDKAQEREAEGPHCSRALAGEADTCEYYIGPEFSADRPARAVPGVIVEEAEGLQKSEMRWDRPRRIGRRKGLFASGQTSLRDHDPFYSFEKNEACQRKDMERPQPAEAPDDVKYGIVHRSNPPRVGVRNDETAKDEEEVDVKAGVSDERRGIEVVRDTEM